MLSLLCKHYRMISRLKVSQVRVRAVSLRRQVLQSLLWLIFAGTLCLTLEAQATNQLISQDQIGSAQQGFSAALSVDGNTAIVGGPVDNGYAGAAWVYTRTYGKWTQQGNRLVGSDAMGLAQQGFSVAVSADGNTAIVGGFWDNDGAGAAWV